MKNRWNRRLPLLLGILCCVATLDLPASARARKPTPDAENRQQIRDLESRIALLEKTVADLKSTMANGKAPAPNEEQVAVSKIPPIAPPPPRKFEMPPELLPQIGKIGAEVGLLASASSSPFRLSTGSFVGGYIDLPLFDRPQWLHGKVSYEIMAGLSQSKTTFNTTSNVAQVANLSVLNTLNPAGANNLPDAVSGTGSAPFPVTVSTETSLRLLQVVPFALKYTPTVFDRFRVRPYVLAGAGIYVAIHTQNPARGTPATFGVRPDANLPPEQLAALNTLFSGQAPFGGPLVAGQLAQSPELEARGLPSGHGSIGLGYQLGGGVQVRLTRTFSLGFDARYNQTGGASGSFSTYGSQLGFHF